MTSNDPLDRTQKGPQEPPPDRTLPALGADAGAARPAGPPGDKTLGAPEGGAARTPGAFPPPPASQDPLLGRELGGCRIDALLGRGAMGAVYKARQVRLDREVAVKVIRPELLVDPRMLKRFEVEARTVGRFNSPHVVMVHDVGFELGVHFLVMEFVKGKNLRDHTKLLAGGRLPVGEALPLLRQACKGLEEAQRLKVLHRDIKPDNLMLTDRGVLKIADFGIAKPMHEDFSMTMTSELIGTPLYMSPEQCHAAADLDFRSDMYSLGATFYYLLTGEPPIRASSVYELIQTKTKLENLCLWKALPELDENHPLSRVIERMTALDREDRYPSYEALLADLVLVEQGRTMDIQRPKTRAAKPEPPPPPPPPKRRGGVLAGAVVLALAAGGTWAWWQYGTDAGNGGNGRNGPALAPDGGQRQLQALRQRLADAGPTPDLRVDLEALVVDATLAADREALLADVAQGIAVKQELDGLAVPAALDLPFDTLQQHLQKVDAAAAKLTEPRTEPLRQWLAKAAGDARAERELGSRAIASLVKAFADWNKDLVKSGGDAEVRVGLRARLDAIEAGRKRLLELLTVAGFGEELQSQLPSGELGEARLRLEAPLAAPVVDVGPAIARYRAQFEAEGPKASLEQDVADLQPNQPEQRDLKQQLINDISEARQALALAQGERQSVPLEPELPFQDVEQAYVAIDGHLQRLRRGDGSLPAWAAAERSDLRREAQLQPKVLERCRTTWSELQRRGAAPEADLAASERQLGLLREGIDRGRRLFPAAAAEFDGFVAADALGKVAEGLALATRARQWFENARGFERRLDGIVGLAGFRKERPQLEADLQALRTAAADLAADNSVAAQLQRAAAAVARWNEADERVTALAKALAAGDLPAAETAARNPVVGKDGSEEFAAFAAAATQARAAFRQLERELDLDKSREALDAAKAALRVHGGLDQGVSDRLDRWVRAVGDLQAAANDMVAIPAGRTRAGAEVAAFFLARTEASQAEFQEFLEQANAAVAAAGAADVAAQQQALAARLGAFVPPAAVLQRLLGRSTKLRSPKLPVEAVSWFEAAACASWQGRALPTRDEWLLAALGDRGQYGFPWGNDWTEDSALRSISASAVEIDAGGRSWRSTDRATVHHLAGNVAEWLAAQPTDTEGWLAGGRYNDTKREQRERAEGAKFHGNSLTRDLPGFGFRTVLRPRDALAAEFAGGRFPVLR